jgi:hypothetical protein
MVKISQRPLHTYMDGVGLVEPKPAWMLSKLLTLGGFYLF